MNNDPWATETNPTPAPQAAPEPIVQTGDNWVSVGLASGPGYDKTLTTVHGDPAWVAKLFGVKDFDGRLSTLLKQVAAVDAYNKKQYGGQGNPGKA